MKVADGPSNEDSPEPNRSCKEGKRGKGVKNPLKRPVGRFRTREGCGKRVLGNISEKVPVGSSSAVSLIYPTNNSDTETKKLLLVKFHLPIHKNFTKERRRK